MSSCCLQAKAGVIGLTKTVAKEWGAFNIRCNGLAYGFIATRLTADKGSGASMQVTVTPGCQQYNTQHAIAATCMYKCLIGIVQLGPEAPVMTPNGVDCSTNVRFAVPYQSPVQ